MEGWGGGAKGGVLIIRVGWRRRGKGKGKGREVTRRGGFFRYACAMTYMAWGKRRSRRRKGGLAGFGYRGGVGVAAGFESCDGLIYNGVMKGKECFCF